MQKFNHKKWLFATLASVVLALSACGGKQEEKGPIEGAAKQLDSETSAAQADAEIEAASAPMITDREDSPVLPSSDEPEGTGAIAGSGAYDAGSGAGDAKAAAGGMDTGMATDEVNDANAINDDLESPNAANESDTENQASSY